MALSYYLADKLLDHVAINVAYTSPTTVYVALFTVMPTAAGGGTEVTGGSYARQAVTMGAGASGVSSNSVPLSFTSMPAATVVGACLFDALTTGNLLYYGPFGSSATIAAGTDFDVPVGDVVAVMR